MKAVGKDIFFDEIENLLNSFLMKNESFTSLLEAKENNVEEVKKMWDILVEIRKMTIENKEKIDKNSDKTENEKMITKLSSLTSEVESLKLFAEKMIKTEEDNQDETVGNLKDFVKNLNGNLKVIEDKVEKTAHFQQNLNSEIYGKLKKDLASKLDINYLLVESSKILEEYRGDLKKSVTKLEEKLHHKVDKFNLDEFGKKMDTKLSGEIQRKIDKQELKRNNSYLIKKVKLYV